MCLIVDANTVHQVFPNHTPDFEPIHSALIKKKARLVYGGRLHREYQAMKTFYRLLYRMDQQGSARKVSDDDVDAETDIIVASGLCKSDDPHIIALARVGKVRLLCTADQALIADFTNRKLISSPRGKVYKHPSHRNLIKLHCEE